MKIKVWATDVPAWYDAFVRGKSCKVTKARRDWHVRDPNGSGEVHIVKTVGSLLVCDCRGFRYRCKCKHVVAVALKRKAITSLLFVRFRKEEL